MYFFLYLLRYLSTISLSLDKTAFHLIYSYLYTLTLIYYDKIKGRVIMEEFKQIKSENAREYALRYLLHQIVSLNLSPGQKISDMEISKELHISRTPVREAVITLVNQKLINSYPQKGLYVSYIDPHIVEEVCIMRKAVESELAAMSCKLITQSSLDNLYDTITLQKDYISSGPRRNLEKFLALDKAFHKEFYNICDMGFTYDTMQSVMSHFDRQRNLSYRINIEHRVIKEHTDICNALEVKDEAAARKAMDKHIGAALLDQAILKEKFPDYYC